VKDWIVIEEADTIKALASQRRMEILEQLVERPATVKQLAEGFGEQHAKLYYHVKELEKNGLVELVEEVPKGGVVEKYYRAVAKTFLVGRGVGANPKAIETVKDAAVGNMLHWRRQQELAVDHQRVAKHIIEGLGIGPGNLLVVDGGVSQLEFMEHLAFTARLAGGDALVLPSSPGHLRRLLFDLPEERLEEGHPAYAELLRQADVLLSLPGSHDTIDLDGLSINRLKLWEEAEDRALREAQAAGLRIAVIGYPSQERARAQWEEYVALHDSFWRGVMVSPQELRSMADRLQGRLEQALEGQGSTLSLTCPAGTDLRFEIDRGPPFPLLTNDGRFPPSDDQLIHWLLHQIDLELPGGELAVSVVPASVNGTFVVPTLSHLGRSAGNVKLTVDRGSLATDDKEAQAILDDLVKLGKGGVTVMGLTLGLNPEINGHVGYTLLDTKALGNAALVIGGAGAAALRLSATGIGLAHDGETLWPDQA